MSRAHWWRGNSLRSPDSSRERGVASGVGEGLDRSCVHAGSVICIGRAPGIQVSVHSHVRGSTVWSRVISSRRRGSFACAREAPVERPFAVSMSGFICALAGNTTVHAAPTGLLSVRFRGGGRCASGNCSVDGPWFIPAGPGAIGARVRCRCIEGVHPRVRGAYLSPYTLS